MHSHFVFRTAKYSKKRLQQNPVRNVFGSGGCQLFRHVGGLGRNISRDGVTRWIFQRSSLSDLVLCYDNKKSGRSEGPGPERKTDLPDL